MTQTLYIGLMSGTSLDGVDAVLASFPEHSPLKIIDAVHLPFDEDLKSSLLILNSPGPNEIHAVALLENRLAHLYAGAIRALLSRNQLQASQIIAVGSHGQTIRHRPDLGYTVQISNSALLAELTAITVVSDFRSRDIAAGGQGAPLVPAFHKAIFQHADIHRTIVNIGGFSNLTDLPPAGNVTGFDCGPGNALMDGWIMLQRGLPFDRDGAWASTGILLPELLQRLMQHPFLHTTPPKSTGRDTFDLAWLRSLLRPEYEAHDVQATLLEFSARCIADAVEHYCMPSREVYLCGGGARNAALLCRLQSLLAPRLVSTTSQVGLSEETVEAAAFAWLARQALAGLPGNLPLVTGAAGPRVLGAIYPA